MKYRDPLKKILAQGRPLWDHPGTRPAVRRAFQKALDCRTPRLGAEVYGFEGQELVVYHTCKSPACPSCGYRAAIQWLRERWAALPDVPYKGITFTMPDVLWPLFRANPRLAAALSPLASAVIRAAASTRYGVRVGVIAILHTFGSQLKFKSHVHTMVTGGGLRGSSAMWVPTIYYDRSTLMASWRRAIVTLLREALRAGQLRSDNLPGEMETILRSQEERWWSVRIQSFTSKMHFLKYAGRYLRRPPIAQRRISYIGNDTVRFWYNDKRTKRRVETQCSMEEFIALWAQHVRERYSHAVRNFGLFAPRAIEHTSAAIFRALGQQPRLRPKPLTWAYLLKRDFGKDPLLHRTGNRMFWSRRQAPVMQAHDQFEST